MRSTTATVMLVLAAVLAVAPATCWAQVTTATLYGIVSDRSDARIPGADVSVTNEGTGQVRKTVTDDQGEFVFNLLQVGVYTLRVEMPGFKALVTTGIQLAASQEVRQAHVLDVGEVIQAVTVESSTPLVSTVSPEQRESMSTLQVQELPLSRRNVTNILRLSSGVDVGGGSVRINGLGKSAAGITVDGTDANANPSEGRSMEQYGGRNYIDVMSIDAVQEVQLLRGILAAEYGGVVSGQVNLISKSGTNQFHGSLFENYRSHVFNARNPFQVSRASDGALLPKNREVFNQFGGSFGGPILRDRAFLFGAYEGYRESRFQRVSGSVPTPALRAEILGALPFPETKILMDTLPQPSVPIDSNIGRFEGAGFRKSSENHFVIKGDVQVRERGNLSVTYTRNRPFGLDPSIYLNGANDRTFDYLQDRWTTQFVYGSSHWTSETRFGYNHADMERLDQFFTFTDPKKKESVEWQRRVPRLSIQGIGGWGSAEVWQMDGTTYSFDQKVGRQAGQHMLKFGGRYVFYGGNRTNPENPSYAFNSKADMSANVPGTVNITFGSSGPHKSAMYEFGFFAQDDWRVSRKLVLSFGLRYDFYSNNVVKPTGSVPVGIVNLSPPTDWRKFDFGPARSVDKPTEHDPVNFSPRLGFAYNPDGKGKTVVRGGFGVLFAAHVPALLRQSVGHPIVPFRVIWSKSEAQRLGVRYPLYAEDTLSIAETDVAASGRRLIFSAINPHLQNPYTLNYQLNVARELKNDLMVEVGYVGLHGVKFPLHRRMNLPDRITGERPNPLLIPGGYYVDNSDSTVYHSLQTSIRKRFSRNFSFDGHYTWGKSLSLQGGDVGVYYGTDATDSIQDFFNPSIDRGYATGDVAHRFVGDWIYQLPYFSNFRNPILRHALGGWQISGILSARTGTPAVVTQSCSLTYHCRPDFAGGDAVLKDWQKSQITTGCRPGVHCDVQYINKDAFVRVPVNAKTGVAIRPGTASKSVLRNPGSWGVDTSLSKNFKIREATRLQFRVEMFNALNHVNLGGPNTNVNSGSFGRITGAGGMRSMQAGARLIF